MEISLLDALLDAWNFEYLLTQCVIGYLLFDAPILYRRFTRKLYAPIYFTFFPFGHSDELYSRYFDEDFYYVNGGPIKQENRKSMRRKIITFSILSLALTLAISPFVTALYAQVFLSQEAWGQLLYTIIIAKALLLLKSLYDLREVYRVTENVPFGLLITLYISYWVVIGAFLAESYEWIGSSISSGGLSSVFFNLVDFLVFDIGVGIVFVATLGIVVQWQLTGPTSE